MLDKITWKNLFWLNIVFGILNLLYGIYFQSNFNLIIGIADMIGMLFCIYKIKSGCK